MIIYIYTLLFIIMLESSLSSSSQYQHILMYSYIDVFYKYFILTCCVYMIKLKLIELTLAIYAFITVIIIIACITSTVIFHHSSALISAYIIIAIMNSNTLYATYYPISTYYNFPPHLMPIPLCLFDCTYACMYVVCIDDDNDDDDNDVIVMMIYYVLE